MPLFKRASPDYRCFMYKQGLTEFRGKHQFNAFGNTKGDR